MVYLTGWEEKRMNGKGDKYRIKWSKKFESNYERIFNGSQEDKTKKEKSSKKTNKD